MALKLIKCDHNRFVNVTTYEYLCDTDADFANLPAAPTGSTAVSIATGNIKVVNTSGEWVTFGGTA